MKLKHIALATLALVAGVANAANITTGTSTGLVLFVTNNANNTSYGLDLGQSFASFNTSIANAAYTQNWSLDSNWTSFYNAANSADYVWSITAGYSVGSTITAGNNYVETTVNKSYDISGLSTKSAGSISLLAANINNQALDINAKAGASSSFVASASAQDASFFGGVNGGKVTYFLNKQIDGASGSFAAYNAIGDSSIFLKLGNTGTRTAGTWTPTTSAGLFTFDGTSLKYGPAATVPVTPSVPEPSTYGLALVGLLLAGAVARRRA
jgi:hypothetical protein